ncbi:SPATA33 isoform 5, partial [Pan troglodytes]
SRSRLRGRGGVGTRACAGGGGGLTHGPFQKQRETQER